MAACKRKANSVRGRFYHLSHTKDFTISLIQINPPRWVSIPNQNMQRNPFHGGTENKNQLDFQKVHPQE